MNSVILTILVTCSFVQAQDLKFEQYGIDEGLSQNTVSCILQDSKGLMWFGTRDGLNKYDGYKFTIYKRSLHGKHSISTNDIKAIIEDASGKLWIATYAGGVNIFNPQDETFEHLTNIPGEPNSLSSNYIRTLIFDSEGILWIGTSENGLDSYDPKTKTFAHYVFDASNPNSISDNTVTTLFEDENKNLWIGTVHGGLNLFDRSHKSFFRLQYDPNDETSLPHNNIQFITQDSKHRIWVGTYGGGLSSLDEKQRTFRRINPGKDPSAPSRVLLSVTEDNDGNLWIGTENDGLQVYNPDHRSLTKYYHYDSDNTSIGSNAITALRKDSKGNIWIGTFQGGINMLNRDALKFKHYKHHPSRNSLSNNAVTGVFEDSNGNLWIGTDGGGLNILDNKTHQFKHLNQQSGLPSNHILTINEDKHKKIWIGTWGQGVSVYDSRTGKFKHYKNDSRNPRSLSSDYAFYIFRDSKQRIWIATYGNGLDLYNEKDDSFTRFTNDPANSSSISANHIMTIYEDRKGRLWIGTDGGGLNYFDEANNKFESFKVSEHSKSISNNIINSICEDDAGNLWLGTNAGLDKFDPNEKKIIKSFYTEQGLPNDVIAGILHDSKNHLWIGTAKGLSRFDLKAETFTNFTRSDGIQGNEFRAQCKRRNGHMVFAGKNGVNEFDPNLIKNIRFDPPIIFTGFQIFNKEVPISTSDVKTPLTVSISETRTLLLSYQESVVTFEFASLNYTGHEKKQYRYKLEGFDKDWNYVASKNSATYTNLNPGNYKLVVAGLTNDGQWSNRTAELSLTITPPFWRTWWFKLICLLALTAIIALTFYVRLDNIKQRNKQLKAEVEKRTSELVEANSSLVESNEEIKLQNEKLEDLNQEMARKSEKILQQQEKIILQNHELEETVDKLARTNQTKDRFVSILAHDLKNPISALTGITDVLKTKASILKPDELLKYIHNINQSSHAVDKLLKDLLDWAKTHAHDIPYSPTAINIKALVEKNIALAEQQIKKKYIQFNTSIHSDDHFFADYNMIDTAIRNIIHNSIKFTPEYGSISISAMAAENDLILTISDSGVGMTEDKLQNLFKIDKKHTSTGTHGETGTGLGLIITKEFIDINKGHLSVTSEPGKGSQFSIRLPKGTAPQSDTNITKEYFIPDEATAKAFNINKLPEEKLSKIKDKRILIVDDNKEVRSFLRLLLSGTCEIFEAENGEQGMAAAIEYQPVVIISDMVMPVMDGLAFCKQLKSTTTTSHIPVVLLTSKIEDEHQLSGYEAGADIYLMKPVKHDILFQVLHNLLANQERIHQKYAASNDIYPENLSLNKLDEAFLNTVVSYIEAHLSEPNLDHKKICDLTAMSRSLLYAKIKTLTGQGVHDLIKSIRLKKGLQLLVEGRLNITQVAFEVGFVTPSHFSKSFVKQYGVSPSEYISNLKKKAASNR